MASGVLVDQRRTPGGHSLTEAPLERVKMPAVGASYKDVHDQIRYELQDLHGVLAAYTTVDMTPPKVHVWTLVSRRDPATDERIGEGQFRLLVSFPQLKFDFTVIHLGDRDPIEFIPDEAEPVIIRDRRVLRHFQEVFRTRVNAGA